MQVSFLLLLIEKMEENFPRGGNLPSVRPKRKFVEDDDEEVTLDHLDDEVTVAKEKA